MADLVAFGATVTAEINKAQSGDSNALNALCLRYGPPIVAFIRRSGMPEDAEDVAQDVFRILTCDEVIRKFDKQQGRFRSFLLGVTTYVMNDWKKRKNRLKRGGGAPTVSAHEAEAFLAAPKKEPAFDLSWIESIVHFALEDLKSDYSREPEKANELAALLLRLQDQLGYPEIAEKLRIKDHDVKNYVHRARERLRGRVRRRIEEYCLKHECDAEYDYLMGLLG
jgi:RNA polymerase sigma factor (sigma-70 family)